MSHSPYQCLEKCGSFLVAASGCRLDIFSLVNGLQTSSWRLPPKVDESSPVGAFALHSSHVVGMGSANGSLVNAPPDSGPPPKRRKATGDAINAAEVPSTLNCTEERGKIPSVETRRRDKKHNWAPSSVSEHPAVTALTATQDGKYLITVGGDDKSIRVFQHDNGHLKQLNQFSLSKRPCAITIMSDAKTIIFADKFGDVYSLPLLVSEENDDSVIVEKAKQAASSSSVPARPFVPAANDLTVHSKRNLRALQSQRRQYQKNSEKLPLHAKQHLLLGHVSMLTDVVLVERGRKSYIVTADRDEHIRISRGIPQTHITENYCLGHTEFVSQLCIPTYLPHLLVSGGGDVHVFVWDWLSGTIFCKVDLTSHIENAISQVALELEANDEEEASSFLQLPKIAVTNIKELASNHVGDQHTIIAVTCECIPVILLFTLSRDGTLSHHQTVTLRGNPLAMLTNTGDKSIILSLDTVHSCGSKTRLRGTTQHILRPLLKLEIGDLGWSEGTIPFESGTRELSGNGNGNEVYPLHSWSRLLYPLENLRKKGEEKGD